MKNMFIKFSKGVKNMPEDILNKAMWELRDLAYSLSENSQVSLCNGYIIAIKDAETFFLKIPSENNY